MDENNVCRRTRKRPALRLSQPKHYSLLLSSMPKRDKRWLPLIFQGPSCTQTWMNWLTWDLKDSWPNSWHEWTQREIWNLLWDGKWKESYLCLPTEGTLWHIASSTALLAEHLTISDQRTGIQDEPVWPMHHEQDSQWETVHHNMAHGWREGITCGTEGAG